MSPVTRLGVAILAAYAAGYAVEIALGNWDPRRVGWSASFLPVLAEGGVFGYLVGGIWGALLAPLPIFFAPETWVRAATLLELVGPFGLLMLAQPLPAMWAAGAAGAILRHVVRRRMVTARR
jgi:hypothetical protein